MKSANDKKTSNSKEKEKVEKQSGFHDGYKKGINEDRDGGKQQGLCLIQLVAKE